MKQTMPPAFRAILEFPKLKEIFGMLAEKGCTPAIFGGAIRDTYMFGLYPNDIDVVVEGMDNKQIEKAMRPLVNDREQEMYCSTYFGGGRYHFKDFQLDIWGINETWALKNGLVKKSLFSLPKTTILSSEAILYLPTEETFLTGTRECDNFWLARETFKVERNAELVPSADVALKKIKKLVPIFEQYGFDFGPRLQSIVNSYQNLK